MIPRFFCPFPLHPGATVELAAAAAHHGLKVLRVGAGDAAILFDGHGGQWLATLHPAGKSLRATLHEFDAVDREAPLTLTLVQALPASDKMDFVVQKATELGVSRIQPVLAKRSVIRLSGERAERRAEHWRNISIAACEQCGRNRVPVIGEVRPFSDWLSRADATAAHKLVLSVGPSALPLLQIAGRNPQAVLLLSGPEGGLSPAEEEQALTGGFAAVSLGPRILRAETAPIAALAALTLD